MKNLTEILNGIIEKKAAVFTMTILFWLLSSVLVYGGVVIYGSAFSIEKDPIDAQITMGLVTDFFNSYGWIVGAGVFAFCFLIVVNITVGFERKA